jgi:hypothetical protein
MHEELTAKVGPQPYVVAVQQSGYCLCHVGQPVQGAFGRAEIQKMYV